MMLMAMWPFCSQQDKRTRKFLLKTCGACKQLSWLEKQVRTVLGWQVRAAVPTLTDDEYPFENAWPVDMIADNALEQVRWDVRELREFFTGADIALLNHETLATPVRRLFPDLRIVQMCSTKPSHALFEVAWCSADRVVVQNEHMRKYADMRTDAPVSVWPMAYDESDEALSDPRDVDVFFVCRASATNYTHHVEFLAADLAGLRVAFSDVTGYLRRSHPDLEYSTPEMFRSYLARSKVAVALQDDMNGGLAIKEACRAGCTPLVLDRPWYRELVGDKYPHVLLSLSPASIARGVREALDLPMVVDVSKYSYQASWEQIRKDLCSLC